MKTVRLVISGRVQGVGYRDWLIAEAERLGLSGWVRNVGHSQVEAVLQGGGIAVDDAISACRNGPVHARVNDIAVLDVQEAVPPGFLRRRSI